MNCPTCKNEMVKAKATNFGDEYDYCRTCKKELKEMEAPCLVVKDVEKLALASTEGLNALWKELYKDYDFYKLCPRKN